MHQKLDIDTYQLFVLSIVLIVFDCSAAQVVKLLLAVAILFTYPLQLYVPIDLLWTTLQPRIRTAWHGPLNIALRIVMVCGTIVVSLAVPNLSPIISLIGALFFSTLGLFIPAVVDTATHWVSEGDPGWNNVYLTVKNGALMVISILSIVAGTYSSVLEIIDTYTASTHSPGS